MAATATNAPMIISSSSFFISKNLVDQTNSSLNRRGEAQQTIPASHITDISAWLKTGYYAEAKFFGILVILKRNCFREW